MNHTWLELLYIENFYPREAITDDIRKRLISKTEKNYFTL